MEIVEVEVANLPPQPVAPIVPVNGHSCFDTWSPNIETWSPNIETWSPDIEYVNGDSGVSPGLQGSTDAQGNVLAFTIPDEQRLMRFLVLGCEGGTYYASESTLTERNATCVTGLIESGHGEMVVQRVVEVVTAGRAIRVNSALLTLAMCCRSADHKTKSAAYRALSDVCNIPTHLFKFIRYMESQGKTTGWGRGLRKAMSQWYNRFATNPQRLAMLVTKYRQRDGWTHRDILRLAHMKPADKVVGFILRYAVKGLGEAKQFYLEDGHVDSADIDARLKQIAVYLDAVEEARCLEVEVPKPKAKKRKAKDDEEGEAAEEGKEKADEGGEKVDEGGEEDKGALEKEEGMEVEVRQESEQDKRAVDRLLTLIFKFDLLREHLHSSMLEKTAVWQSLLEKMPIMATIRNLSKMTAIGLLGVPENVGKIVERLGNKEAIRNSKVFGFGAF